MHFANRVVTATVLLAGLLPLATFAFVLSDERIDAERAFRGALEDAQQEYQLKKNLPLWKKHLETKEKELSARVIIMMREKRTLRLQISALKERMANLKSMYGLSNTDTEKMEALLREKKSDVTALLRYLAVTDSQFEGEGVLLRRMTVASLGTITEEDRLRGTARGALTAMADIVKSQEELDALLSRHRTLLAETQTEQAAYDRTAASLRATDQHLANIQRTVQEVHEQVIKMQGVLARIDAKIRARIERDLIEKGLLTPGTIDHSAIPVSPQFSWPAYGPISAGFQEPTYQEHFGIPHLGMDIVIGQGSPVFAAAEGVVFLAHDGGAHGYSYVLVGHRGGYATLYGHLSRIAAVTGQDIAQGDLIGMSGGAVGAPGSGPTTTGPHLHFEVIESGTNINPRNVLP